MYSTTADYPSPMNCTAMEMRSKVNNFTDAKKENKKQKNKLKTIRRQQLTSKTLNDEIAAYLSSSIQEGSDPPRLLRDSYKKWKSKSTIKFTQIQDKNTCLQ